MLLLTLVTYLVFTAYNDAPLLQSYRLAVLSLLLTGYVAWECLSLQYSYLTLLNDWFLLTPGNGPVVLLLFLVVLFLLGYATQNQRYTQANPWVVLLIIANLIGLVLFPMVNDLIPLYVVIELQSYSLYLLTGVYNRSYNATRGAMVYFVTGGIASVLILLASVAVYRETGLTNLSELSTHYAQVGDHVWASYHLLVVALIFKMGLAPLHAWSIAVYSYAPTYITAYISIVAKVSILSFIYTNIDLCSTQLLMVVFYLSVAVAAYTPLYQVNLKAILAYSGILNFGYLVSAVAIGSTAYYVYLAQYSLTHVALFLCLLAVGEFLSTPNSRWSPLVYIHQLVIHNKALCLALILCLLSLIGIPPLPGFYAKYLLLVGLLSDGLTLESLTIVVFSVVATYYYAFLIKRVASSLVSSHAKVALTPTVGGLISLLMVILVSFYAYLPSLLQGFALLQV
uniref:NADH-ubiquinone oxidoreductase chain 2 n=1 Tax=Candida gigantensis TaxID=271359 RepID=S5TP48_9ASCO|nr:NADH dehydrogenase subunit 2 [Candida gigantensis]AGS44570.1 NADH dehydrogenase subunit 2 [Candida gigantensis]